MSQITKELTIELDDGREFTIEVTATASYDSNYGADADGNRGMGVWDREDDEFTIPDVDAEGYRLDSVEKEELEKKLNLEIERQDWDFSSADEKEYEPEDEPDFFEGDV